MFDVPVKEHDTGRHKMGKVYTGASTSIDGYVSGPDFSGFDKLFAWYEAGDVAFTVPTGTMTFHLTPASAPPTSAG